MIPFCCFFSESIRKSFDLSYFRDALSAFIRGHVNVIIRDFMDYEIDCVLHEQHPLFSLDFPINTAFMKQAVTKINMLMIVKNFVVKKLHETSDLNISHQCGIDFDI